MVMSQIGMWESEWGTNACFQAIGIFYIKKTTATGNGLFTFRKIYYTDIGQLAFTQVHL